MSEVKRWYTRDPDKFLPTAQVRVVLESDYDALAARVAELEKDAARYRWFRDALHDNDADAWELANSAWKGRDLDANIDAQLSDADWGSHK